LHLNAYGERWQEPKARGVFVCDMSDLFGIGIPEEWTRKVLGAINEWDNRSDRFYLLTKQPRNLIKFSPFPENCWVGFTATDNQMFNYGLVYLSDVKAKVKYASLEPLLGGIEPVGIGSSILDWVIIGACTGSQKELLALAEGIAIKQGKTVSDFSLMPYGKQWTLQPQIEWVEEIKQAARRAGIPIFEKDNLKPLLQRPLKQELPK